MSEQQPLPPFTYVTANAEEMAKRVGAPLHPDVYRIQPFGNRMVVVRERPNKFSAHCNECGQRLLSPKEAKTCRFCGAGGLLWMAIPDIATDVPCIGWVVSVGPECHLYAPPRTIPVPQEELPLKKVLFAPYGGNTINLGEVGETLYDGNYLIIEATSVLAMVAE